MYEIDKEKRYNVTHGRVGAETFHLNNVSLKQIDQNFVVVIDEKGKEHLNLEYCHIHL